MQPTPDAIDVNAVPALGVQNMDQTHQEFAELVNRLACADGATFISLFAELLQHTESHFATEDGRMQESGFPAIREHRDEHARVLGELTRIHNKLKTGSLSLARAYVRDNLPDWFKLHLLTMDSALAAHILSLEVNSTTVAHLT
jgi:hemerythrin-like metal-binding protein